PTTAATFIRMHKDATDKTASAEALKFFKWAFEKGGKMAEELDYIPMPEPVVKLIEKTWSVEIRGGIMMEERFCLPSIPPQTATPMSRWLTAERISDRPSEPH